MKLLSEKKAVERLKLLAASFKSQITDGYEHRSKDCLTCEVKGSCCLDAHFVNVHISRLEAVNIHRILTEMPEAMREKLSERIVATVETYGLTSGGDTYSQTYACPLFEKGTGCLVHNDGKPTACTMHACYENKADLPPDALQTQQELKIDRLNEQAYGRRETWLPLPLALRRMS